MLVSKVQSTCHLAFERFSLTAVIAFGLVPVFLFGEPDFIFFCKDMIVSCSLFMPGYQHQCSYATMFVNKHNFCPAHLDLTMCAFQRGRAPERHQHLRHINSLLLLDNNLPITLIM